MPVTVVIDDSDDEEKKVAVPVNTARSAHNAAAAASTDAKAEAGSKRAAPEEPEDKGAACTICLEPIESSGPHGPANLKCGHIFGKECIQKWIACKKEQKVAASCPQCNKKCKLSDVTPLFNLPTVVSSDAAERQELAAKLAEKDKEMEGMRKELQELKQQQQQLQLQACSQQPGPQQQQLGPLASGPSGVGLSGPGTRPFAEASRNLLARHAHPHHQAQQPLQQGGWQSQGQPGLWAAHHSQPAWQLPSGGPPGSGGAYAAQTQARGAQQAGWQQQPLQQYGQRQPPLQLPNPMHTANYHLLAAQQQAPQPGSAAAGVHEATSRSSGSATAAAAAPVPLTALDAPLSDCPAHPASFLPHPPIPPHPPIHSGSSTQQQPPGPWGCPSSLVPELRLKQLHRLPINRGRCFDMHLPLGVLLLAEEGRHGEQVLRKVSLHLPETSRVDPLPRHVGLVRDICFSPPPGEHSGSKGSSRPLHVALATKGAGLLVWSVQSSRVVASYTLPSPAWSCAWSTTNQHQLFVGLHNGWIALVDMRLPEASGTRLLACVQPSLPIHSLAACCLPAPSPTPTLPASPYPSLSLTTETRAGVDGGGSGDGGAAAASPLSSPPTSPAPLLVPGAPPAASTHTSSRLAARGPTQLLAATGAGVWGLGFLLPSATAPSGLAHSAPDPSSGPGSASSSGPLALPDLRQAHAYLRPLTPPRSGPTLPQQQPPSQAPVLGQASPRQGGAGLPPSQVQGLSPCHTAARYTCGSIACDMGSGVLAVSWRLAAGGQGPGACGPQLGWGGEGQASGQRPGQGVGAGQWQGVARAWPAGPGHGAGLSGSAAGVGPGPSVAAHHRVYVPRAPPASPAPTLLGPQGSRGVCQSLPGSSDDEHAAAGPPLQLAECDTLWGHTSKMVFTRATFLSPLPQQQPDPPPSSLMHETAGMAAARSLPPPVFVAADEDSCRPWVWCLKTGAVLQVLEPHNSPILSLRAGWCPGLGSVLVVCSASYLDVYTLVH